MTGVAGPFTSVRLSSTPSIVNPLKRGLVPPTDPPEPATPPCCVVVPGANTANSSTEPPTVLIGRSLASLPPNVVSRSDVCVFTRSAPACTSITAATEPTVNSTFSSVIWLDPTCTFFCTYLVKPFFSTVNGVKPAGECGENIGASTGCSRGSRHVGRFVCHHNVSIEYACIASVRDRHAQGSCQSLTLHGPDHHEAQCCSQGKNFHFAHLACSPSLITPARTYAAFEPAIRSTCFAHGRAIWYGDITQITGQLGQFVS